MRLDRSASSAVGIPVLPGLETGERKREGGEDVNNWQILAAER